MLDTADIVREGIFANSTQLSAHVRLFLPNQHYARSPTEPTIRGSLGTFLDGCSLRRLAANYDYGALAGVYVLNHDGEKCILDLRSDRTFTEELTHSGNVQRATGNWHRYGES